MMRVFLFNKAAPETRCPTYVKGGGIRVYVVARPMVRQTCGAVSGMALHAPMT